MNKLCYYAFLCSALWFFKNVDAQQVVAASGTTFQKPTISITFTLGELVIDTRTASSVTLTQGFHQTKVTVTAVNDLTDLTTSVIAYPNPTSDWLKLKVEKLTKDMEYALYDINGKLLATKKMESNEIEIPLTPYSPSTYFLKVKLDGKEVKTFKIVKQ